VTTTSYTFTWVGDNHGRWRITAVAPDGTRGPTSGFFNFSYITKAVLCQGTTTIEGTFFIELDSTGCGTSNPGDVFWEQFTATSRAMVPINGAKIALIGVMSSAQFDAVTWHDLRALTYGTTPIDGSDPFASSNLRDGTVFAVLTSDNHVAKVRVNSHSFTNIPNDPHGHDITVSYVTYNG
jgi:hypothetical protein